MAKEDLLEGLRDLERRERPGTAAAQLREIEAEINDLLAKRFTQKQVWTALTERGLKLSFSGFKTWLHRMQQDVRWPQKVSKGLFQCPRCGSALTDGAAAKEGAAAESATDLQPAVATQAESSYEGMGAIFARRLEKGGFLPTPPTVPTNPRRVPGDKK